MEFTLEREKLLIPLLLVNSVIEKRQTLPILANVLLRLKNKKLIFTGTDLEVEVTTSIKAVSGKEGDITVTGRKMLDICKAVKEQTEIKVFSDGSKLNIRAGRSRFTLQAMPAEEYPTLETMDWEERITVNQAELKTLLDKTSFSMANQDVRYYLNGLLLELGGGILRAVATDGHRLAKSEIKVKTGKESEIRQVIIPRKAIMEISRFLNEEKEKVVLEFNQNHFCARSGEWVFTSKLIDGRFPDYAAVLRPKLSLEIDLQREEILETLARTAILTNEKFRGVRLSLSENRLTITANNPEQEEASDELEISYSGDEVEIGFNVNYLMEALRSLKGEQILLKMQDANSSCMLLDPNQPNTQYLVMPMRL